MKYAMRCTCGYTVEVDAEAHEEAVEKIKGIMTEDAIAAHMEEKHPGDPDPTKSEYDAITEATTYKVENIVPM